MTRVLVVGDIHLNRRRVKRSQELLHAIQDVIKQEKPEHTVLLGDVFDTHDVQHNDCVAMFSRFLDDTASDTRIHHVLGNHEMNDSKTFLPSVHALVPWETDPELNMWTRPGAYEFGDTSVGFVPFVPNGRFNEALEILKKEVGSVPSVIFAHQEFLGCEMSANKHSESGDEIPDISIISGHIHGEQKIKNVWYPGTPCQHNFSEDEEKFVFLLEISNNTYKIIQKIDLGLPKFRTIHSNATELPDMKVFEGEDVFRVVIKDTQENIILFKQTDYYKQMHKDVKFKFNVVHEHAERVENEQNLSFSERFTALVIQENLKDTYEDIFGKLQTSSRS